MTCKYVGAVNIPTYIALSTDLNLDYTIDGACRVGGTVYFTDTAEWYILGEDLTIGTYIAPTGGAIVYEPTAQATSNTYAIVGQPIDCVAAKAFSCTLQNTASASNSLKWKVLAGNTPTIAEAIELQAEATLAKNAYGTYSSTSLVWRYIGIYVESASLGAAAQATLVAIAKP